MNQTISNTHEVFSNDDTLEILPRVYQGDVGALCVEISFTQNGTPMSLAQMVISLTNRAPNGALLTRVGGNAAPLEVEGATVKWTLEAFDTRQVGTYHAQIRVASDRQIVTVVFLRYNVERSVTGKMETSPVQYATLSELVAQVNGLRDVMAALEAKAEDMESLYDEFKQIMEDNGVTWETLPGKPLAFPPATHTHAEFVTYANDIAVLRANQQNMVRRAATKTVTIDTTDWTRNEAKMRYETTVSDGSIQADSIVVFQVPDADNGAYDLAALTPKAGTITLYTYKQMTASVILTMTIYEEVEDSQ